MKKTTSRRLLPLWGYVLLNVVMLSVLAGTYFLSERVAASGKWVSSGTIPVLGACYLAFLFVSVYDYVFDRATPDPVEAPPGGQPAEPASHAE